MLQLLTMNLMSLLREWIYSFEYHYLLLYNHIYNSPFPMLSTPSFVRRLLVINPEYFNHSGKTYFFLSLTLENLFKVFELKSNPPKNYSPYILIRIYLYLWAKSRCFASTDSHSKILLWEFYGPYSNHCPLFHQRKDNVGL